MRTSGLTRKTSVLPCVVVFLLLRNGLGEVVLHLKSLSCSTSNMNCSIIVGPTAGCIHGLTPTDPVLEPIRTVLLDVGSDWPIPVLNITWRLLTEASIKFLNGTEVCVTEDGGVNSTPACVHYHYHTQFPSQTIGPTSRRWQFSFVGVEVKRNKTYEINIKNHPRLCDQDTNPHTTYHAPGCKETPMSLTFYCIHTGGSWEPSIAATLSDTSLTVAFTASNYSRNYTLALQGNGVRETWRLTQDTAERTEVNFTDFKRPLQHGEYTITLKAYFALCGDACDEHVKTFTLHPPSPSPSLPPRENPRIVPIVVILIVLAVLLAVALLFYKKGVPPSTNDTETPSQPSSPRKVLIVYSQDHALFRDIVLHFASFLQRNCNVEVILDLWQVNKIAEVSHVPWLSQHIEDPDVVTIIVCSKGAQAKWRAMCQPSAKVELREDSKSPLGDMFTPAMSLILGDFQRGSYERYSVVYFDDGSGEEDIPLPLKVTVRYKLMKHSEELFFRIQNMERHVPGTTFRVPRLSGDYYPREPHGQKLKDAMDKFRRWKAERPDWFEEETGKIQDASSERRDNAVDEAAEGDGLLAYETTLIYAKPDLTSDGFGSVSLRPSVAEAGGMHTAPAGNTCLPPEYDGQPPLMLRPLSDDFDAARGEYGGLRLGPGCDVASEPLVVHSLDLAATSDEGPAAVWNPAQPQYRGPPGVSDGLATDVHRVQFPGSVFRQDSFFPGRCHVDANVVNYPQPGEERLFAYDDGGGHVELRDDTRGSRDCAAGDGFGGEEAPLSDEAMKHLMQVMLQRQ